jgi:preprotein translocase subunit SecD
MVRFTSAPVEEVLPRHSSRQPSKRAQIQKQYQEALRSAVLDNREALVVELEPDDKALTIRNRIKRAAELLGVEDIAIRRRRDRIIAFLPGTEPSEG